MRSYNGDTAFLCDPKRGLEIMLPVLNPAPVAAYQRREYEICDIDKEIRERPRESGSPA
jgi:hypothetical protein